MDRGLQHFLDALERRWRFTLWLDLYLETAFVTSVLLAATLLAGRLALGAPAAITQGPALAAVINGIVLGGSGLAAMALVWIAGRGRVHVAAEADRALHLDARLLTADELLHSEIPSLLAPLLLSDVVRRLEGRRVSDVFALPRIGYRWATMLALAAISMAVLAPPNLTWSSVRKNPMTLFGVPKPDDATSIADNVPPPEADFQAFPLKGKAPLDVRFEDRSRGEIDSRLWDFSDVGDASSKTPRHTFRKPGKYTITLEVAGPGGRDIERKVEYIEVEPGDNGGGSDERAIAGLATPYRPKVSDDPLQGRPDPKRPEIQKVPVGVDPLSRDSDVVKKPKFVFEPGTPGDAAAPPPSYEQAFPAYRRVAEESVGREHIPSGLREFVRAYFEKIAPK